MCQYDDSEKIENNTWINVEGTIEKGNYFGEIPIINITNLEITTEPENSIVKMPDENYITTSNIY